MRKHDKNYKFDAEKFFQQMEERYGSYDSGMNVFRRDTEFFRQRQTFSYQEQGSPDSLNLSLMAGNSLQRPLKGSSEEYVSNEYQNGYGENAELYGELLEKILQFFRLGLREFFKGFLQHFCRIFTAFYWL